jgi:hypothetical protein
MIRRMMVMKIRKNKIEKRRKQNKEIGIPG